MKQQWYCDTYTFWFNTTLSWSKTCLVLPVSDSNESCFHQPKAMHFYSPPTEVHSSSPQHNSPLVHFRLHLFLKCMRAIIFFPRDSAMQACCLEPLLSSWCRHCRWTCVIQLSCQMRNSQASVTQTDTWRNLSYIPYPPNTHCGAEQSVPHWDNAELYVRTFWGFWKIKGITDFYFLPFCFSFNKTHKDLSRN